MKLVHHTHYIVNMNTWCHFFKFMLTTRNMHTTYIRKGVTYVYT